MIEPATEVRSAAASQVGSRARGPLLALGSALCAAGCLLGLFGGAALWLLGHGRLGPATAGAGVVLGVFAGVFNRLKMRALYGPVLGDVLHEADSPGQSCTDMARRDLDAYCRDGGPK